MNGRTIMVMFLILIGFSPLVLDLFRGGSSRSDKLIVIGFFVILISISVWFLLHPVFPS